MTDFPAPLVATCVDLTDFAYMPLDVRRLRDSDLAALESPEACWAAVLLWAASWHQVPAASLPDDDRVLSNLAGYGRVIAEWQRVRDGALHGWVKCSDGRLYHQVVAEKANEAWQSKLHHSYGKLKERLRKSGGKDVVVPAFDEWVAAGIPPEWVPPSGGIHGSSGGIPAESQLNSAGKKESSGGIPAENALKGEVRERELNKTPHNPPEGGLTPDNQNPETPPLATGSGNRLSAEHSETPPLAKGSECKAPVNGSPIAFKTFLDRCKAVSEKPISDFKPVWDYAEKAGIQEDIVVLCWQEFSRRYGEGGANEAKRYRDWRAALRKSVECKWFWLWTLDDQGRVERKSVV